MGWMVEDIWNGPLPYKVEKKRVEEHYTGSYTEGRGLIEYRPLHISNSRPAWYVAVEVTAPASYDPSPYVAETLPDGRIRYVFAEVMLTRNTRTEWGYKCICEAAGPNEVKAPVSLIKKLSPIDAANDRAEWAIKWRARVQNMADHKARVRALKPGQRIKLHTPAHFGQSGPVDMFEVVDPTAYGYRKTSAPAFKTPSGAICTLRADTLAQGFDILT